jgi:hypothetical protein
MSKNKEIKYTHLSAIIFKLNHQIYNCERMMAAKNSNYDSLVEASKGFRKVKRFLEETLENSYIEVDMNNIAIRDFGGIFDGKK